MKWVEKGFWALCVAIVIGIGHGIYAESEAVAACKALGYDYGSVNFNPRRSYYCKNITRYWVIDGELTLVAEPPESEE